MAWVADPTPGFSLFELQRNGVFAREPWLHYSAKYGFGTIEIELTNTKEWRFANEVANEMRLQGIDTEVIETEHGFICRMVA